MGGGCLSPTRRSPATGIDVWFEKERKAEPERGGETHRRVRRDVRVNCRTRTQLTTVREVSFIQFCRRNGGEQVRAKHVDLRRTFNTVRGISVGGHVECLRSD